MVAVSTAVARPSGLWLAFRRNRLSCVGLVLLAAIVLIAALAPLIAPYDPIEQHIAYRLEPPSAEFLLGTDTYGRDVLSRLIHGARISLIVGLTVALISITIGLFVGLIAGYMRWVDAIVMRLMDGLMAIPAILLAIAVVSLFRAGL